MSVLPEDIQNPPAESKNLSYSPQVNSFDGLSDTMLMVRLNPETKKINVLSIPRDTRVMLENQGVSKINAANVEGGPALSAKAVSQLLEGVGIDRYVRINVLGFGKLVDALGGIDFYVPRDMKYKDDTQHLYVDLKEGQQHLNGDQAMQLMRFRHDRYGDIGRIQRQQLMMRALIEQALNPTTLGRMPKILSVIQSHIDTNLSVEELMALTGFAARHRSNVQMLVLPGDFNGDGRHEVSYWLPNRRRIQTMMAQYFDVGYGDSQTINPASMRVSIQDSTGNPNAVKALVKTLTQAGYPNVTIAERWHEPLRVTRIVAQQGDDRSAQSVQQSLGIGQVRVDGTGNLTSDVTIQLGRDWLQRQGTFQEVSNTSQGVSNRQTLKENRSKRRNRTLGF
jgi:LCP family protein required for cell wall assembly